MRNDVENIRAERDLPYRASASTPSNPSHAGIWKQIAIGIVVGIYC
ncbi:hypothetical protein V8Z77_10320 [Stutzerimonas stutzeri]|nr:hypothetical protein [Stutzerimonas stutzeri]